MKLLSYCYIVYYGFQRHNYRIKWDLGNKFSNFKSTMGRTLYLIHIAFTNWKDGQVS